MLSLPFSHLENLSQNKKRSIQDQRKKQVEAIAKKKLQKINISYLEELTKFINGSKI